MNQKIKDFICRTKVRQVFGLFSVNIIGIPIGIIASIVITKYLGPQLYGDYKFLNNIFTFSVVLFTFGFFQAGNRAIILAKDKSKIKEYYGSEVVLLVVMFLIMSISLIIYTLFDHNIADKQLTRYMLYLIPFGWIYLLQKLFETLFPSDNRIKQLGLIRLLPKIINLLFIVLIFFFFKTINVDKLLLVYFLFLFSQALVYIYVLIKINISFNNIRNRLKEIWSYNKSFGFKVYSGALFDVGIGTLTGILISYFGIDNSGVGFYALALTFASPLSFIPNTVATTHYRDFSISNRISKKLIFITLLSSILALLMLWVLVGPFVRYFYGNDFISVIRLNYIVSVGVIIHGFADLFNRFLGANGQGIALRNGAILTGIILLILNLSLIPKFGEYGAAYTNVISAVVYFFCMFFYYIRVVNEKSRKSIE